MPEFRSIYGTMFVFLAFAAIGVAQDGGSRQRASSFHISEGTSFSASTGQRARRAALPKPIRTIADDLEEAFEIVDRNHVWNRAQNAETTFSSAMNGMLRALDPHSAYFTRREFQDLADERRGRYVGIGVTISEFTRNNETGVYVVSAGTGTPAGRAGVRFGDRIVKINDVDVGDGDSTSVRNLIRGEAGTTVSLTLERHGETAPLTVAVRRAEVFEPSVSAALIFEGSVGYIALTAGFNETTAAEFNTEYKKLRTRGMQSLIIDLRGNGGGLMEQSIMIAEKFLPAGREIVSQKGRHSSADRVWRSRTRDPETLPLVLLVDESTASASEILAAAMQDNDRATIVGARTFGKGFVQDVIPLGDGSGLILTSERYYAPSGRSIQREYSDSGLYDYFRHVKSGTLIDKPTFAARTLKGRIVYGGDGVEPDISVPSKQWSPQDLSDHDAAFFKVRESADPQFLNARERRFAAARKNDPDAMTKAALDDDLQFLTAVKILTRSK